MTNLDNLVAVQMKCRYLYDSSLGGGNFLWILNPPTTSNACGKCLFIYLLHFLQACMSKINAEIVISGVLYVLLMH